MGVYHVRRIAEVVHQIRSMKYFLATFLLSSSYLLSAQSFTEALYYLPDLRFEAIKTPEGYESAYVAYVRQPLDHTDAGKGHFEQRIFISHRSADRPTVIVTEGYNRSRNRVYELSRLLQANQIIVEHRFFGASVPDSLDYRYLNLEQATADIHRVRELFKEIYSEKWVSTGISKGGQTTIYYRYFYPDDVAVSVPYVAPLNLDIEDQRIYKWLEKKGSEACRTNVLAFQRRLLAERGKVLPKLEWYAKGADLDFTYLTLPEAFEYAVLEYPFSLWQWGTPCADVPDESVPIDSALTHLLDVVGVAFFSDRDVAYYGSHYYQAADQMGYYGYDIKPFKDLIKALPTDRNPSAAFVPGKQRTRMDYSLPKAVDKWLKKNGDRFLYIYGADDTWTATGVPQRKGVDAEWFIMEGKSHGDARIKNMTDAERARFQAKLEEWLGIVLD